MTFEEFRNKWYNNDCYVERSKFTIGEYDKQQEKLFNQALADERRKYFEKIMSFINTSNREDCAYFVIDQIEEYIAEQMKGDGENEAYR